MLTQAQDGIPTEYLDELKKEVGTWVTDNSRYHNDQEPSDQYGINWEWGMGKKSIKGRLFGMKDGEELGTFWEFRKYWDPVQQKVIVMQFGGDGTVGIGPLDPLSAEGVPELTQVFTAPNGVSYNTGHETVWKNDFTHVTISYDWNEERNKWVERRSYTWTKQATTK